CKIHLLSFAVGKGASREIKVHFYSIALAVVVQQRTAILRSLEFDVLRVRVVINLQHKLALAELIGDLLLGINFMQLASYFKRHIYPVKLMMKQYRDYKNTLPYNAGQEVFR